MKRFHTEEFELFMVKIVFFFIGFGPRHVHEQHSRTPEKYFIAYWGPLESFLTEKLEEI